MSDENDDAIKVMKLVVAFDICSSTNAVESLIHNERFDLWQKLQIRIKNYLLDNSIAAGFSLYKFMGDGWILLFHPDTPIVNVFSFLRDFGIWFQKQFEAIRKIMHGDPSTIGLTFGIDKGTLLSFVMNNNDEYIGKAINVACRLQAATKAEDAIPQYKVMIQNHLVVDHLFQLSRFPSTEEHPVLKNVFGDNPINCYKFLLRTQDDPPPIVGKPKEVKQDDRYPTVNTIHIPIEPVTMNFVTDEMRHKIEFARAKLNDFADEAEERLRLNNTNDKSERLEQWATKVRAFIKSTFKLEVTRAFDNLASWEGITNIDYSKVALAKQASSVYFSMYAEWLRHKADILDRHDFGSFLYGQ